MKIVFDQEFTEKLISHGFVPSDKYTGEMFIMDRHYYVKGNVYVGDIFGERDLQSDGLIVIFRTRTQNDPFTHCFLQPILFDQVINEYFTES